MVLYGMVWHGMVQYNIEWNGMVYVVWFDIAFCAMIWLNMVLYIKTLIAYYDS